MKLKFLQIYLSTDYAAVQLKFNLNMYIKQFTAIHYDVVINSSLVMMEYFEIFLSKNHKITHKLEIRGKRFLFRTLFVSISITELRCRSPFDIDNRFRFDYYLFLYLQQ